MSTDRWVSGVKNIYGEFDANSGNIDAGDAVKITSERTVDEVDTSGEPAVGVAMYGVSSGEAVAVALVGAVVRVNAESGVSAGDRVTPSGTNNGRVDTISTASGSTDAVLGIAITAGGTPNSNECIMLITGVGGEVNR